MTSGCIGQVYLPAEVTVRFFSVTAIAPFEHDSCSESAECGSAFIENSLFQKARENMVHLVDQFGWLHRLCFLMFCILADHAGLEVAGEKFNPKRIERGTDGRNLVQDINAIAVLFDHSLDAGDLAGNTIGPAPDTFARILKHGETYTRYWYNGNAETVGLPGEQRKTRPAVAGRVSFYLL
jgi:hypothetical protein